LRTLQRGEKIRSSDGRPRVAAANDSYLSSDSRPSGDYKLSTFKLTSTSPTPHQAVSEVSELGVAYL
jgi:hypothetical protein